MVFFPYPRSRLRNWARETGSAVPSGISPLVLHTQAESDWLVLTHGIPPSFRDGVHISHQPPSGNPRVNRVTQLRTDGVHCRKSAGTGPVVLKVVRVTGAAFSGFTVDQFSCTSLFPHPLYYWYEVDYDDMRGTENIGGRRYGQLKINVGVVVKLWRRLSRLF